MFAVRARTSALRFPARTILARFESTDAVPGLESPSEPKFRRRYDPERSFHRTHFLTIPLYENSPQLQSTIRAFRNRVVECNIPGFTEDTVIPRLSDFLELRLGHLNIEGCAGVTWQQRRPHAGQSPELTRAEKGPIPLNEVLEVLNGLKAPIQQILSGPGKDGALHVPLGYLRPMLHGPRVSFNARKVNILFLHPSETPAGEAVRAINQLVFQRFKEAGMWVDIHRAPTLSMTLANTRYGPGNTVKAPGEKVHLDVVQLYESAAFSEYSVGSPVVPDGKTLDNASPRPLDLGEGIARSIHLVAARHEGADVSPSEPTFKLEFC